MKNNFIINIIFIDEPDLKEIIYIIYMETCEYMYKNYNISFQIVIHSKSW